MKSDLIGRRELLRQGTLGIGSLALAGLLQRGRASANDSFESASRTHHPAKCRNVIFLHMLGGPSQVDTFDPKPELNRWEGQTLPEELTRGQKFAFVTPQSKAMPSPYRFAPQGECGIVMCDQLPHLAGVADELTVIRSMRTNEINHGAAELFMQTGHGRMGRPAFGAWASYGLGSECDNLPAYVVLRNGMPLSGTSSWSAGFLPPHHQGVGFRNGREPIFFLENPSRISPGERGEIVKAVNQLNTFSYDRYQDPEIAARIAQYELAFRMQSSVPDLVDLKSESKHTLAMYGIEDSRRGNNRNSFGRNCLLARRLVEQGVRFVQVFCGGWDHHLDIYGGMPDRCQLIDQPCAGLIRDLKQRGLLDDTLVIWGGEFGRTPMVQDTDAGDGSKTKPGRDHHKEAFSIWMAGGGVKAGCTHGTTDDFGFSVVEDEVHVHDLHATCLHLLGLDHERLTHRFQGRDFRLTDVHGHVVHDILA